MQAGKLDRRVTIESYSTTRDANGGEVRSWSTLATVWANKHDMTGFERGVSNQEALAEVETTWLIRYRSDVTAKMRLYDGVSYYNIEGIAEIGRKWGLQLKCKRVNA